MKYRPLGRTGIHVSEICLGTMTWGSQNNQGEANAQLDRAVAAGVNFIDTAELYPTTPRSAETTGKTEEIVGNWLAGQADRDKLVVATKVTGEGNKDIRDGARVTGKVLREALEGSLRRLRTDHVDLYQLHWPNRGSYHFRQYWNYDPRGQDFSVVDGEIADLLGEVQKLIDEGKLRAFGLSNETAWGLMKYLQASERHGLPRVASIQNEYSLLCREFDTDMAEACVAEDVTLMAYSPLAAGLLSGKYRDGRIPAGSRRTIQEGLYGRLTPRSQEAVVRYCEIAEGHGMHPAQLALAFCISRPFPTIPIIGATSMEQLEINLATCDIALSEQISREIDAAHRAMARPM